MQFSPPILQDVLILGLVIIPYKFSLKEVRTFLWGLFNKVPLAFHNSQCFLRYEMKAFQKFMISKASKKSICKSPLFIIYFWV